MDADTPTPNPRGRYQLRPRPTPTPRQTPAPRPPRGRRGATRGRTAANNQNHGNDRAGGNGQNAPGQNAPAQNIPAQHVPAPVPQPQASPRTLAQIRQQGNSFLGYNPLRIISFLSVTSAIALFILQYFMPAAEPQPSWHKEAVLVAETVPHEPLMLFDDLSALHHAWVSISGFEPFQRSWPTLHDPVNPILFIFIDFHRRGTIWNKYTGAFSYGESWEGNAVSNETHVDMDKLYFSLKELWSEVSPHFEATSETRIHEAWYTLVLQGLHLLKNETYMDAQHDPRALPIMNTGSDGGNEIRNHSLPAHLDSVKTLRDVKAALQMAASQPSRMTTYVNDHQEISRKAMLLEKLNQLLYHLGILQNIVAHTSSQYLVKATEDERWIQFPLFGRITAEWNRGSPLFKAHKHAEHVSVIGSEGGLVSGFVSNINGMIEGLNQIVSCEVALEQQVQALLSTAEARRWEHMRSEPSAQNYTWIPSMKAWLTTKLISGEHSESDTPRGLDECAPLYDFNQEGLASSSSRDPSKTEPEIASTKRVMVYIPLAAHLHEGLKKDLEWTRQFRDDLFERGILKHQSHVKA